MIGNTPPPRSYLYVPGSDARMMEKALRSEADVVVLDLEDAVAPNRKEPARQQVAAILQATWPVPIYVRVNSLVSGLQQADLEAVAGPGLAAVRIPKVEAPEQVVVVAHQLERLGCAAGIQCLLESALGVELAFAIARADPRVIGIGLGEADLRADLGVGDEAGLEYARSRIVVAARAARLPAPAQSVYPQIRDHEGLRRSTEAAKQRGFFGRSLIHPAQIAVVHEVFTPSAAELQAAQELVERLANATALGTGAIALADGRFVDEAVVAAARRTLALASTPQAGSDRAGGNREAY